MTRVARLAEDPSLSVTGDAISCSVLWIVPDDESDLANTANRLANLASVVSCWGFLCRPAVANPPRLLKSITGRNLFLEAALDMPSGSSVCEVAEVDVAHDAAFWSLFGTSTYQRQLGGALFYEGDAPYGAWLDAAIQLALVAGSLPFWRLPTSHDVQDVLLHAFIAETIAAGGIALTKVVPEMFRAGLGISGSREGIDAIERQLVGIERLPDEPVQHSLQIGGPWPR
jgi:hypothetical protein